MDLRRDNLRALVEKAIPFLRKVVVKVEALEPSRVRLRLPHDPSNDNYVGMTHAAAIFAFGETCAGAAAGANFDLSRLRMLARHADITYRKPVVGDIWAVAEIASDAVNRLEREVDREGRAALLVTVRMENALGEMVAWMTVNYDFRMVK